MATAILLERSKNGLALPLGSLRAPKSDRLLGMRPNARTAMPFYTIATIHGTGAIMPCKAHLFFIALVIALGSMQMLASCGQKGDLYLPEEAPEERR